MCNNNLDILDLNDAPNSDIYVDDVFLQEYGGDFGMPSHWAVKYYIINESWPVYEYFDNREDAYNWARNHGWPT